MAAVDGKWLAAGLAAVGLLWWRGRGSTGSRSALVTRGPVDLIGDSLAVGLAAPMSMAFHGRIQSPQGEVFRNWGVGGTTAPQWTGQKLDGVLGSEPAAVLISLGTNDSATPAGTKAFGPALQKIVDKVHAAGAVPVILSPPEMPWDTSGVRAAMSSTGAVVVGAPAGLERAPDKIHLTPAGYEAWAKHVVEAVT